MLTYTTLFAQEKDISAKAYLEKGEQLFFYGKYEEANTALKNALQLSENTDNSTHIAASYNGLSKVANYSSQLKEALQYAETALTYSRQEKNTNLLAEANALDNLGLIKGKMRMLKESLEYHTAALKIRENYFKDDNFHIAQSLFNVGVALHRNRRPQEALKSFDNAFAIKLEDSPERKILYADIYEAIGFIHYSLGQFDKAFSFFEKTDGLAKEVYEDTHPYFGKVFNDFGLIYSIKEQYNESLKYYKKSLSVSIANYGVDKHADQVRVHYNIGTIYQNIGQKENALFHTQKCLDISTKIFGENHPQLFYPYSQLGQIYGDEKGIPFIQKALAICMKSAPINYVVVAYQYEYLSQIYYTIKNYEEALQSAEKSLEIRLKLYGAQNMNTIRNYNNIAKIYAAIKDYEKALIFNEKAITANNIHPKKKNNITNHITSITYIDNSLFLESVKTKADILFLLFENHKDEKYLVESMNTYNDAASFVDFVRKSRRNHKDQMKFSETVKAIYAKIIQTTLLLNESKDNPSSLVTSFYASEKSRAHVLRALSKNEEAKKKLNLHEDITTLEKNLNSKIAALRSEILEEVVKKESDSIKLYQLEGHIFDLSKRKDSLEKHIESTFPKYYNLKYNDAVIGIPTLQEKLNDSTTLLEFFKNKNDVFAFIITKNSFHVKRLEVDHLDAKIEELNANIANKNNVDYTQNALYLYKQLIAPIADYFVGDELIIIPDESLWYLSFDALLTEEYKNKDQKLSYFLFEYAISYANSASLLFEETAKNKVADFTNECIAFSYTNKDSLPNNHNTVSLATLRNSQIDLPGTRKEIKEISNILEGTYFYGNDANEMNFKKHADKSKIIHLALHGDIDNNNPDNLKIYFSEGSSTDDDKLFSHELYALDIPADLVVLSACNTGSGKINKAEGIQSLGNAFQYAGATSLLLSSWEISDAATPEIMRYFYTNIKDGMPKHKALQQAKIDFLKNGDHFTNAPFYWGSFYLLGNTEPIHFTANNHTNWIIGIAMGILLLLLSLYIFKQRRK